MSIDVERMKSGVADLKKVLEEAEKIRSWAYTNGESSDVDGEEYSELLYRLDAILTPFQECGWDIKKTIYTGCNRTLQYQYKELKQ